MLVSPHGGESGDVIPRTMKLPARLLLWVGLTGIFKHVSGVKLGPLSPESSLAGAGTPRGVHLHGLLVEELLAV
jgi:hypothetical protein